MTLQRSISSLPGVGPKRRAALEEAGIRTVLDLLLKIPRRYSDQRSSLSLLPGKLSEALKTSSLEVCVEGRLQGVRRIFTRRRGMNLVQGQLVSSEGQLRCVWFNRPYLASTVDESQKVLLCGSLRRGRNGIEIVNAEISDASEPRGLVPHYGTIAGLGGKTLRRLMHSALGEPGSLRVTDPIPNRYLSKRNLPTLGLALEQIHRPSPDAKFDELAGGCTRSHQRLIYGDLFSMQTKLARASAARRVTSKGHCYRIDDSVREVVRESLPFRLTPAQKRALKEIVGDMQLDQPMLRLLQGDVGCGKTVVAAVAALVAAESGLQVAILSPTEVLAEQMAFELRRIFNGRHGVGLLTGSSEDRISVLSQLENGAIAVVSGTHALIQNTVRFQKLSLVIVDEQQRFGVEQRAAMAAKGNTPDVLLMTATPIPRSLALAVFGDLAISSIDQLPPGRQDIATRVLPDSSRSTAVEEVQRAVEGGGRAFVVFPRIDNLEECRVSLEEHGGFYESAAPGRVERLTGRTGPEERARILTAFRCGDIAVLLATTVVEVGIDVPEATLIVIEGAEHFGLSQLHQLRGRVGRGGEPGACVALHRPSASQETMDRLMGFASIHDGFKLSEMDLRSRGPGDLLGVEQSGFSDWTSERLANAVEWLQPAREDAIHWVQGGVAMRGETAELQLARQLGSMRFV